MRLLLVSMTAAASLLFQPRGALAQWSEETQDWAAEREEAREEERRENDRRALEEQAFCETMGGPGCDERVGDQDESSFGALMTLVVVGAVAIAAYATASSFEDDAKTRPAPANSPARGQEQRSGASFDTSAAYSALVGAELSPETVKKAMPVIIELLIAMCAFCVLFTVATWRLFAKAGKPGWSVLVPIYNWWVLLEVAGFPGWLLLVPFANWFVTMILVPFALAERFGRSVLFGCGLLFGGVIFYPWLAFGSSRYVAVPASRAQAV